MPPPPSACSQFCWSARFHIALHQDKASKPSADFLVPVTPICNRVVRFVRYPRRRPFRPRLVAGARVAGWHLNFLLLRMLLLARVPPQPPAERHPLTLKPPQPAPLMGCKRRGASMHNVHMNAVHEYRCVQLAAYSSNLPTKGCSNPPNASRKGRSKWSGTHTGPTQICAAGVGGAPR